MTMKKWTMKSFWLLQECYHWHKMARNEKKMRVKCEINAAKYPAIRFLFFAFREHFMLFRKKRIASLLSRNMRKHSRNAKNKKCIAGCFSSLFFFAFCASFFIFRIWQHFVLGSKFVRKVEGFLKRNTKFEWNTKSVWWVFRILWCVLWKHLRNAKYKKCIAGIRVTRQFLKEK